MLKHKMTVIDLKLYSYIYSCNFNNINTNIFIPNSLGHYWARPQCCPVVEFRNRSNSN